MRLPSVIFFMLFFGLISCSTLTTSTAVSYKDYPIEKKYSPDTALERMLRPYTVNLNATMNKVIGFANRTMNAKQPESGLGNFMADCMKQMAEKKYGKKVDAGFMNHTGIRSYIAKGNITVGKVYELMPFDNLLVVQEISGAVLLQFLHRIAAEGGWPVSAGLVMGIKDGKAVNVTLNGKPLDENSRYTIANSDYVANGGNDCEMLKKIPQQNKSYLVRDALIDFISEMTAQGKPLDYGIENRVSNVN
jgi:2',3'-cyclic-nucleotide 2'-phosphodiesterase (5'-nucleotidase family)